MKINLNLQKFEQELREGTKSLLGVAGAQIGYACTEAYEELVRETPQWTGETAASWSMGFIPGENQRMHVEDKPSLENALAKGMQPAVNLAMVEGLATMPRNNLETYLTRDLVLTNPSPRATEVMIGGEIRLRPVNQPGASIEKFINRVEAEINKHR